MMRFAVSSGYGCEKRNDVKRYHISSGSGLRSLILVRKVLALLIVCGVNCILTRG